MRRLFIMRKDLHMSTGKLLAQTCHCAEAYWTMALRKEAHSAEDGRYNATITISKDVFDEYICCAFVKTICEAKSKTHLLKAKKAAEQIGLIVSTMV